MSDAATRGTSPPNAAPRAPAVAVRVFASFLVARAVFGGAYIAAAIGRVPIAWYHPLDHTWELAGEPRPQAMGWYGLTAAAALAAAVLGLLVFLASARGPMARALARTSTVLAIAHAGGLVLLVDFAYFGWTLSHQAANPWPEPDCRRSVSEPAPPPTAPSLRVPRTTATFKLDGEASEPPWNAAAARTGAFVDAHGEAARPYSEARFLWDAENLYVLLYAADNDILAHVTAHDGPVWIDDSFSIHLTPTVPLPGGGPAPTYSFDVNPAGVVTDARRMPGGKDDVSWESGIKLGVDLDGKINESTSDDEEWVVEAAIPLASMGIEPRPGTRVLVDVSRCDTPRGTKEKRCGAFGSPAQPRVLVLSP
jgi:Carbohydrate family 9 binding domain-like